MFMGVSDASEFALHSQEAWGSTASTDANSIIGLDDDGVSPYLNDTYNLHTGQSHVAYLRFLYRMTFGPERLRGNPSPQWPIEAWQYSQSHPVLLPNVSDFEVHFAADANNDGEIDRDEDGLDGRPDDVTYDANDPIVWYGSYDTNGDPILPDNAPFDYQTNWTGGTTPAETYNPLDSAPGMPNADFALTWRHDDGEPFTAPGAVTNSKWPYLIRIRYRAHDSQGELTSTVYDRVAGEDVATSGKWFEVIFRVPRPQ
ncbi:MAG: hypothetical protein ACOC3G_02160, partial [Phycisphaeraceae bacterium]